VCVCVCVCAQIKDEQYMVAMAYKKLHGKTIHAQGEEEEEEDEEGEEEGLTNYNSSAEVIGLKSHFSNFVLCWCRSG